MSKHRAARREVRGPRRVRMLAVAVGVTMVIGGTAVGVVPQLTAGSAAADQTSSRHDSDPTSPAAMETATYDGLDVPAEAIASDDDAVALQAEVDRAVDPGLPAGSGDGRRIVFSQSDQRVWLVGGADDVERTYLVSGSRFDNLKPGSYRVQSKTRQATAFDYSGTMEYFVRFATGFSEPIGFHSVPRDNAGNLEQAKADLGTALSAGCVRQWRPDAIALWDFAPVGTAVIVLA